MTGLITGAVVIYLLFFGMCFLGTGTDKKNMGSYYSYPDAVQEKIREDEKLRAMIPKKHSAILSNIILFTVVFTVLGVILKLGQFWQALCYFLIVGEGLNIFDLLVIDMCWWRNTRRTRFSSIQDRALYRDMKKHVGSFCRGIPVFAASALVAAAILAFISSIIAG